MPTWPIMASDISSYNFNGAAFLNACGCLDGAGVEARVQALSRDAYTWANLYVRVTANTCPNACAFSSQVGGVPGTMLVLIGGGLVGVFADLVNNDPLVNGSLFDWLFTHGGGGGGVFTTLVSSTLTSVNNSPICVNSLGGGLTINNNTTIYLAIDGRLITNGVETRTSVTSQVGATLSNFRIYIQTNTMTVQSTFRLRKNFVNGNEVILLGAGLVGAFEDAVNTDVVVAGNTLDVEAALPVDAGKSIRINQVSFLSTSTGRWVACARPTITTAFGVTEHYPMEGSLLATGAAEASAQATVRCNGIARNFQINVITNTLGGVTTCRTRVNGVNGAQLINIGAGLVGVFEDLVNNDALLAADLFNYQLITGGAVGVLTYSWLGIQFDQPGGPAPGAMPYNVGRIVAMMGG